MRELTTYTKSVDVVLHLPPTEGPQPIISQVVRELFERAAEAQDLRMRALLGDPGAVAEVERRAEVAAREKAERAALRAERRRWREAYQWAKWGE